MALKLRVISDHYRELGDRRSRVFGVNGGSIGRAPDNDWVLPDPRRIVSGHHCDIEHRGGRYVLRDTSTNGVYVNDSESPVSDSGPRELVDGDRVRIGDYEILVSIDERTDFLHNEADRATAARHVSGDLGSSLDLDALLSSEERGRDSADSGSMPIRTAFGMRVSTTERRSSGVLTASPDEPPPPPRTAPPADWALKTRPITREELNQAIARRGLRPMFKDNESATPAATPATSTSSSGAYAALGADAVAAAQAVCRGAGLDPAALSPGAQAQLPTLAGQLLRELVLGLGDLLQSRAALSSSGSGGRTPGATSNPIRASDNVEQALQRLFESHGRWQGGSIEAVREALQELRDHDEAAKAAVQAGVASVLERLSPANMADQFESGRAGRTQTGLTGEADPRPRYWEHYSEFHRLLTQHKGEGLPPVYQEAYERAYQAKRAELQLARQRRR
jgi:type VI secretion system protein